jgi:hypothetical protein
MVYVTALEKLGKETHKWTDVCCKLAVERLASVGCNFIIGAKTIALWNMSYREQGKFPHHIPIHTLQMGSRNLSHPFLR